MDTNVLFESAMADFNDLNKFFIESVAQVAHNTVVFESVLSEEVLMEADDKSPSKFKTAVYKAIEALKRAAQTVFNKIRVAINEFVAKANQNSTNKYVEAWKKDVKDTEKSKDGSAKLSQGQVQYEYTLPKDIGLGTDSASEFFVGVISKKMMKELTKEIDQKTELDGEKFVKGAAAEMAAILPANYNDAKKALKEAKSWSDINKICLNLVSYAKENKKSWPVEDIVNNAPDLQKVSAKAKKEYNVSVQNVTEVIKQFKAALDKAETQDKVDAIKNKIQLCNMTLSGIHAGYIGYLKWSVVCNKMTINAIKSARKATNESFLGIDLL